MQRRLFLRVGVGGALVVGGAVTALVLRPGDTSVRPKRPLHVLPERVFPVLVAVAARVLRGTSGSPLEIAHRIDETLRFAPPRAGRDLAMGLSLLENALGGVLVRGSATPFTLLDEGGQDAAFGAWRDSGLVELRGAYHALRKLCLAAHYASVDCFAEVSYPGPSLSKPTPPSLSARSPLAVAPSTDVEGTLE
jgi:hypothetical protein